MWNLFSCNTVENMSGILMMAILAGTFLTIFFFTYVSSVEKQIAENQIIYLANNFSDSIKLLPTEFQNTIKTEIQNTKLPDFTSAINSIEQTNNAIIKKTCLLVGIILVLIMIAVYILSRKNLCNFSFWNMLGKNLIILIFIGLTEFVFLNVVPKNYISLDPNFVKFYAINKLYPDNVVKPELNNISGNIEDNISSLI